MNLETWRDMRDDYATQHRKIGYTDLLIGLAVIRGMNYKNKPRVNDKGIERHEEEKKRVFPVDYNF